MSKEYGDDPGKTHWDDCWRVHHGCAIAKIERAQASEAVEHLRFMVAREAVRYAELDRGIGTGLESGKRLWAAREFLRRTDSGSKK